MSADLTAAYDYCQRIARSEAKNFYYAFRTLPAAKRRAIYAAYAFCRLCDDIADDDHTLDEKHRLLGETRQMLEVGQNGGGGGPVFTALKDATSSFDIPVRYLEEVVEGVEMDLTKAQYDDFDELRTYCYKVASAVGLICVEVFGYEDPKAREYAVDLGIAMQLTNIVRDVKEDATRGRIYIPLDEMKSFGYSPDELNAETVNGAFTDLMAFQVDRARRYFERGRRLIPLLSPRSRACPTVLIAFYSAILDRIEASGYDVFQKRVGLRRGEKLVLMARLWATSLIPVNSLGR